MRQWELFVEWLEKRYSLSQAEAEDTLYDCLVRLLQRFLKENPDACEAEMEAFLDELPDSLLFCVLKRELYNRRRARKREQEAISKWVACHMYSDDPETVAMEHLEEDFLISQLPEPAREIALLWKAGYRWKEIAEQLGLSVSAVKMRFFRAMDALREKMGVRCDDSAVRGVNYSEVRETVRTSETADEEVYHEPFEAMAEDKRVRASGGECGGNAEHPLRDSRVERGGATSVALTTTSESCGCSQPVNRVMSEEEVKRILYQGKISLLGGGDIDDLPPLPGPVPPIIINPPGSADPCCTMRESYCHKRYFCLHTNSCGRIFQRHNWKYRWECRRVCNRRYYNACTEWQNPPVGDDQCCQWSDGETLPGCNLGDPTPVICSSVTIVPDH